MISKLHEEKNTINQTIELLKKALNFEKDESYKSFLNEQIKILQKALQDASTPETYKVAIIGSFKVGKSSFVNALCDTPNLASVDSNPETAAITIFRYDRDARAEVHMITREDWNAMIENYNINPSDPRAVRYKKLKELENPQKTKSNKPIRIAEFEKRYISLSRVIESISCKDWTDKKCRKDFANQIQKFMSRRNPIHYLVEQIVLYVPVP